MEQEVLDTLSKKSYYTLVYPKLKSFAALDRDSGMTYPVDDISFAWLRRDKNEFVDYCRMFPDLTIVRVTFALESVNDE